MHRVSNPGPGPATSIHAYSPPLTTMTVYRLAEAGEAPGRLPHAATGSGGGLGAELGAGEEFLLPVETVPADGPEPGEEPRPAGRSVEELLVEARSGLARLTPAQAAAALAGGALLVDIRPPETRRAEGEVPGAVAIARNVLEWRLDPAGDARLPGLSDYGSRVVVMCDEGYASSFAARGLRRLGLDGTDVIGGFRAWMAAGLPVVPWSSAL